MKKYKNLWRIFGAAICFALIFGACKKRDAARDGVLIAVFIPGSLAGSDTYQMLAAGVQRASEEYPSANVSIIEAGFNQAEWETKLTALAAASKYDVIISTNPSMPAIADAVTKKFPSQRFMIFDGTLSGNKNIFTIAYNNNEQSYALGYLAGLLTEEKMSESLPLKNKRIGLITAQEYPVMMQSILPGYTAGAKAVLSEIDVDFRIIGNWYDAAKAADIASLMIADGCSVILTIAGGANDGTLAAAEAGGAKVLWFDTNGYALRPGVVAGSCVIHQESASYNKTKLFLEGTLPFGTSEIVGFAEGYVDFVEDDPIYIETVSSAVRQKQAALIKEMRNRDQ